MNATRFLLKTEPQAKQIVRGTVLVVHDNDTVLVNCDGEVPGAALCDVLQSSEGPDLRLAQDDTVLVWLSGNNEEYGVILGRIGPSHIPEDQQHEPPDSLVIEAKNNLTFKCGEGSIILRGDGKILIKGKDLVSRAQRMNRIKGGAIAIN